MATPPTSGDPAAPAATVGRYEFVSELLPGTWGALWKARIASGPEAGRVVVIRRLKRTGSLDARAVELLTNVGFAAMELRHPKIAAVLDVVVADAEIAVVSEHIAGNSLASVLRAGPDGKRPMVTVEQALRIGLDLLDALAAVREPWAEVVPPPETDDERRVNAGIHGGLTPEGVLIASFGESMLLEAGLSGVALSIPALAEHPDLVAYRAPEQLDGKTLADERTDIFLIGVILWELVAGRSLFGVTLAMPRPGGAAVRPEAPRPGAVAAQAAAVRRKVATAPIQRLDTMPLLRGKVKKEIGDLVVRFTARDPAARFQSLADARSALLALGPLVAEPAQVAKLFEASSEESDAFRATLESNRPTVPPEGSDRAQPLGMPAVESAALPPTVRKEAGPDDADIESVYPAEASLPPSTDVESVYPAEGSLPPPSRDLESLPPDSDGATVMLPMTMFARGLPTGPGEDLEPRPTTSEPTTLPPASSDVPTVPPAAGEAALAPIPVPPFPHASGETRARAPSEALESVSPPSMGFPPVASGALEETTSAAVVRPLDGLHSDTGDGATLALDGARARRRRATIVAAAAAGAVVLVGLVALLASGSSNGSADADALKSAAPASAAERPAPAGSPRGAAPAPAEPAPSAPNQAEATPRPGVAPAEGASPPTLAPDAPAKRSTTKKKPYRPTGI